MARLHEYYKDPNAPPAQAIAPAAFAAVRNDSGDILLVLRADDGNWELPGGRIDVGESAPEAAIREVAEEAGVDIELTGLSGVYSDPSHLIVDRDGGVRQQLALCFHAVPRGGRAQERARPDGEETTRAAWFDPARTAELPMHPAVRLRLRAAVTAPDQLYVD